MALSLGSLAMAITAIRGVFLGQLASETAGRCIVVLFIFSLLGYVTGRIADSLIRDSVKSQYKRRVAWYRDGLQQAGYDISETSQPESQL
ncbi:MAG: hypothetical protein AAF664_00795 [Planctomycetota bacterium]